MAKAMALPGRHVPAMDQPILSGPLPIIHAHPLKRLVFLAPDLVHGFRQLPDNMEPVEGNLPVTIGHVLQGRVDIGRPHVHADALDRFQSLL